ncbi:unnamed protein product [Urochloa decumbens]|uniref:F-box domain-containing protein n=1 Tax=Urochloa decumbens TaxID=240449 RepID=A0ABC9FNM2_9POAL
MDCPEAKGSEAAVACPSNDALEEILSRLHDKPLCRFKCVSKAWCSLIVDLLRRGKCIQTLKLLGFFYGSGGENYGLFTDLPGCSAPPADRSFSFLTQQIGIKYVFLLDSCNGLLLFGHREDPDAAVDSLGYIVCNPTTEQWVAVPSSGWPGGSEAFEHDSSCTFLIFDPDASSEFKLLQLWHFMGDAGVRTYSSESGVWSCRASEWRYSAIRYSAGSAFVNGMLHFVVPCINNDKDQIVVIDAEGKTRKIIQMPENSGFLAFVGLSHGHLHCIKSHMREMTELSIWVLEDYDTGEWVLKHTVSTLELFGRTSCELDFHFTVVAIHPDRNLVFFLQRGNQKLISYDMDRREVCALCAPGDNNMDERVLRTLGDSYRSITPYVPYFSKSLALARKN